MFTFLKHKVWMYLSQCSLASFSHQSISNKNILITQPSARRYVINSRPNSNRNQSVLSCEFARLFTARSHADAGAPLHFWQHFTSSYPAAYIKRTPHTTYTLKFQPYWHKNRVANQVIGANWHFKYYTPKTRIKWHTQNGQMDTEIRFARTFLKDFSESDEIVL